MPEVAEELFPSPHRWDLCSSPVPSFLDSVVVLLTELSFREDSIV